MRGNPEWNPGLGPLSAPFALRSTVGDVPDPLATIVAYAASLGIRFRPNTGWQDPIWDGGACQDFAESAARALPDRRDAAIRNAVADTAHEIAHWLIAGPDRRHLVNYGFGGDYQWADKPADIEVAAGVDFDAEELRASALGICFESLLGADWRATWSDHSWGEDLRDDVDGRFLDCPEHRTDDAAVIDCPTCVGNDFLANAAATQEMQDTFGVWLRSA